MTPFIDSMLAQIEAELKVLDLDKHPKELYEPIRYILDLGGKRLRPLLTILSFNLFSSNPDRIVRIANIVEIFHNFTLMHDDIMDCAPLRRGQPTVHIKWNANIGILSGDIMMVKAYELLELVEERKMLPCLKAFNRCAAEVCEGQQVDMNFESLDTVTERQYLEMIHQKTAVLLGFSMELGALLADAPDDAKQLVTDFGVNIGMGFQLKDDLLDIYGDQDKFGKQVGGDIIANKKTYLLTQALEQATGPVRAELKSWLSPTEFNKEEKVKAVTAIYDELNIKAQTEQKIETYFQTADQALDRLQVNPEAINELRSFTDFLTHREQ